MRFSIGIAFATGFAASTLAGSADAADKIKVGFFSTLEGPYTALGEDGQRGFDLAVMQHHNKAGGKELQIVRASSDASPDSALRAAKKLVEQEKVEILIAPLSGSEGIALRDYAKTQPQVTVINGCSGALETTYVTPAPNFFRFNIDGAQMHMGLGDYIYNVKHYKKIATVGEDYSFVYTQVFGLALDYCPRGGQITKRIWVPLGTKDFGSVIASLPDDVDAIYLGLGGADAINFLNQYQQAGGKAQTDRRLNHGRSDHIVVEGQGERRAGRRRCSGPLCRHLGRSEVAGVREGVPGCLAARKALSRTVSVRCQLLR